MQDMTQLPQPGTNGHSQENEKAIAIVKPVTPTWGENIRSLLPHRKSKEPLVIEDEDGNAIGLQEDANTAEQREFAIKAVPFIAVALTAPTTYYFFSHNLGDVYGDVFALSATAILEVSVAWWLHLWIKLAQANKQRKQAQFACYMSVATVAAIFADTVNVFIHHKESILWPYISYILTAWVVITLWAGIHYAINAPITLARHNSMKRDGVSVEVRPEIRKIVEGSVSRIVVTEEQKAILLATPDNKLAAKQLNRSERWVRDARHKL